MQQSLVSKLLPLAIYREQREHIFASKGSLEWYLRKHRNGLIESEALLLVAGRWFAQPDRFDNYILAAGAAAAREQHMT